MLIHHLEAIKICRWWVIQYYTLSGERIIHNEGSFPTQASALSWAKEYFQGTELEIFNSKS